MCWNNQHHNMQLENKKLIELRIGKELYDKIKCCDDCYALDNDNSFYNMMS